MWFRGARRAVCRLLGAHRNVPVLFERLEVGEREPQPVGVGYACRRCGDPTEKQTS